MNFSCSFRFRLAGALLIASAVAGHAAEPPALAVEQLLTEIAANNPELKFYEAEIAAAKAGSRTASLRADPELSVELGRKRGRDATGALIGEGTAWSVAVRQTFEWPGRLALRKAIADRQIELAELGLSRFRTELVAKTQTLAFGLQAADVRSTAVREVANRFAALRETFLAREPAGITPLLETRVVEASELTLQRRALAAELALQASLMELNRLRGVVADAPLRVTSLAVIFNAAPASAALLEAARANNFEFRIRRAELEQQGFVVRLAQNERYPAISVGPFVGQENAGERESTFGLSLSLPLPGAGRARNATEVAEARRRQAEVALQVAWRDLEKEVLTAAQGFATNLAEMRRWAADTTTKFREAAELADRHYRLGGVPIGTYVELQTSYLDAVDALLATQEEALAAGLKLQQLTGLDFKAVEVGK